MTRARRSTRRRPVPGFGTALALFSLLALLGPAAVGVAGGYGVLQVRAARDDHARLQDLETDVVSVRGLNQTLLGAVLRRFALKGVPVTRTPVEVRQLQQATVPLGTGGGGLAALAADESSLARAGLALLAAPVLTRADVDGFATRAAALDQRADQQHRLLTVAVAQAEAEEAETTRRMTGLLAAGAAGTALTLFAGGHVIRWRLVRSLHDVSAVAAAVVEGSLTARTDATAADEVGRLGRLVDRLAETLQRTVHDLGAETARHDYRSRLGRALEFADDESTLAETVTQALAAVASDLPAEVLLVDGTGTHLTRFARNPDAPAPGCDASAPGACPALRTAQATAFPSGTAIDACPRLRHRAGGACAAVCLPVTFGGRGIGVLHSTSAPGNPPEAAVLERWQVLAEQLGTRVGNLRAGGSGPRPEPAAPSVGTQAPAPVPTPVPAPAAVLPAAVLPVAAHPLLPEPPPAPPLPEPPPTATPLPEPLPTAPVTAPMTAPITAPATAPMTAPIALSPGPLTPEDRPAPRMPQPRHRSPAPAAGPETLWEDPAPRWEAPAPRWEDPAPRWEDPAPRWEDPEEARTERRPRPALRSSARQATRPRPRSGPAWAATGALPPVRRQLPPRQYRGH